MPPQPQGGDPGQSCEEVRVPDGAAGVHGGVHEEADEAAGGGAADSPGPTSWGEAASRPGVELRVDGREASVQKWKPNVETGEVGGGFSPRLGGP